MDEKKGSGIEGRKEKKKVSGVLTGQRRTGKRCAKEEKKIHPRFWGRKQRNAPLWQNDTDEEGYLWKEERGLDDLQV